MHTAFDLFSLKRRPSLDGNLLYKDLYFSEESTPPFVRLGLEITKELKEVIITVISSQRRQPPNGKGRRASAGEKLSNSFPRKREKDHAPGRLPGRIPWLTYFLLVVYPEMALQACQGRVSGTSFPLYPSSV